MIYSFTKPGGNTMKKSLLTLGTVLCLSVASTITAFAGWEQAGPTWKYQDNGAYYNDGWHWIDGNNDGISECYFFNPDGTILLNTNTPDNYTVNELGAWTVNGVVQTKAVETQAKQTNTSSGGIDTSGWDTGGSEVTAGQVNTDQHLSPEQNKSINDIDFN